MEFTLTFIRPLIRSILAAKLEIYRFTEDGCTLG